MSFKQYIRKNWLGIVGLLVGIAGISLALYFHKQSIVRREPIFVVDPVRTEILSSERILDAPIKVIKQDSSPVVKDLTSVRFFFWNGGRASIKPGNVLRNITVTLEDTTGEIIDYRVLKTSREITKFNLQPDSSLTNRRLLITFDILEKSDGATCQLIYEGDAKASLTVDGTIEGTNGIRTAESLQKSRFFGRYLKELSVFALIMAGVVLLVVLVILLDRLKKIESIQKVANKLENVFSLVIAIIFFDSLIFVFFIHPIKKAKENTKKSIVEVVPSSILPEK